MRKKVTVKGSNNVKQHVSSWKFPPVVAKVDGTALRGFLAPAQGFEQWLPTMAGSNAAPAPQVGIPSEGKKYDAGKDRWDLVPWKALGQAVKILTMGAAKYGANNWKLVDGWKARYAAALMRHFVAWSAGECKDEESGLSHLAHMLCNVLFLLEKELDASGSASTNIEQLFGQVAEVSAGIIDPPGKPPVQIPEHLCARCAKKKGWKWPKGHVATATFSPCRECGQWDNLCPDSDWLKPGEKKLPVERWD